MSWTIGGILFVLLMLLCGPGEAVRCYICSTKNTTKDTTRDAEYACLYPESYHVPLIDCNQAALVKTRELAKEIELNYDKIFEVDTAAMARNVDLDCLKVVVKVAHKRYTLRGCQLAEQTSLDICQKMKKADTDWVKRQYCSRCSSDRCNSAPSSVISKGMYMVIFFFVFLFLTNI